MIIEGTLTNIHTPEQYGDNVKQLIQVANQNEQLELLLFNRSYLLSGFKQGDKVKAVYNSKTFREQPVHYLNKLELISQSQTEPTNKVESQSPKPRANQSKPEPIPESKRELLEKLWNEVKVRNFVSITCSVTLEEVYSLLKENFLRSGVNETLTAIQAIREKRISSIADLKNEVNALLGSSAGKSL